MDDDIIITITNSQFVEGNDINVKRDNETFVDFTIPDLCANVDSGDGMDNIGFTITDSQLVEGNDTRVNRETEPFVDFTVTDLPVVDSDDGIEPINVTMDDDIVIPNTNVVGRDNGSPQRKRIVTSNLTQAVWAAEKVKKKYRKKRTGKKRARIFNYGSYLKQQNTKAAEFLKDKGFLDDKVPVEKADVGETIDLKKTSGATMAEKRIVKIYRNLAKKKPYGKRPTRIFTEDNNDVEDIIDLDDIATLKPSKNAQIAAKTITEKYKDMHNKKNTKADDIDFKITDSQVVDDKIDFTITDSRVTDDHTDFMVTDSRVADDDICFTVTDSRVAGNDIDFNVTDSRVVDDESDIDFATTDSCVDDPDIDFDITYSKVITNQNARAATKKTSQKNKNIRQKKSLKLLKLAALKDQNNIKDLASEKVL